MAHWLPLPEIGEEPALLEGEGLAFLDDAGAEYDGAGSVDDAGGGA